MDHGNTVDGELTVDAGGDFLDFGEGHGFVGLVVEVEGTVIFGMIADKSVKNDDGAVFVAADMGSQRDWIDGFVNERSDVRGSRRGGHGYTSATTYWRKEGNLITGMKDGIPGGELLVAGGDHGGAILLEFGVKAGVAGKKRFDRGFGSEIQGILGAHGDLFQAAEEENLDADRLGNGRHETIVTCE